MIYHVLRSIWYYSWNLTELINPTRDAIWYYVSAILLHKLLAYVALSNIWFLISFSPIMIFLWCWFLGVHFSSPFSIRAASLIRHVFNLRHMSPKFQFPILSKSPLFVSIALNMFYFFPMFLPWVSQHFLQKKYTSCLNPDDHF